VRIGSLGLVLCFGFLSWFHGGVLLEHQVAAWVCLSLVATVCVRLLRPRPVDLLCMLIAFWICWSALFSQVPHDTQRAIFRLGIFLLVYVSVRWSFFEERQYEELLAACVFTGTILSLYGWGQSAGWFDASFWADPVYPACRYVNHNHWAGYLELLLPVAVSLVLAARSWSMRILWSACFLSLIASHWAALSRTGLVCLGFGLGLFAMLFLWGSLDSPGDRCMAKSRSFRANLYRRVGCFLGIAGCLALLVGLFLLFSPWSEPWKRRFQEGKTTGFQSVRERLEIGHAALRIMAEHPIVGSGPGTFGNAYNAFMPRHTGFACQHAHNEWLQAGAEGGAPLFLLFLSLPCVAAWQALRVVGKGRMISPVRIGALSGLVAGGLHAGLDLNAWFPAQLFLFAAWLATSTNQDGRKAREPGIAWRMSLLCCLALLCLLGVGLCKGEILKEKGLQAKDSLCWEQSLDLFIQASCCAPKDGDLPFERGAIWYRRSILPIKERSVYLSQAERELRQAISLNPYHLSAWLLLCEVSSKSRDSQDTEALFGQVQRRFPSSPYPWLRAGEYYLRFQEMSKASTCFHEGLSRWPDIAVLREAGTWWEQRTGEMDSLGMVRFVPREAETLHLFVIQSLAGDQQWELAERESVLFLEARAFSRSAQDQLLQVFERQGGKERCVALLESLRVP